MAKIEHINYLSDFKILETCKKKGIVPFVWIYRGGSGNEYSASFDGETYKNCVKLSDKKVLVLFKDHNLGVGPVTVMRKWILDDGDFHDDICNSWSEEETNVVLGHYEANDITVSHSFVPAYIKGEKGEKGDKGDSIIIKTEIDNRGHLIIHSTGDNSKFELNQEGHLIITL